jgi:hypothetical protein
MSWKCFDNLIHAQFRAAIFFYDIIGSCTQVSRWRDYVIKHLAETFSYSRENLRQCGNHIFRSYRFQMKLYSYRNKTNILKRNTFFM